MCRRPLRSLASLLLLCAACSSSTDGTTTDGRGFAGEGAGGMTASAGAASVPIAGAGGTAGHAGSTQLGNSGSTSGGASAGSGGHAAGGASAGSGGGHTAFGGGTSPSGGAAGKGAGGSRAGSGSGGTSASGASGASGASCPGSGHITYTLAKSASPTATEQAAYDKIKTALDKAITYYDCYTNITKSLNVSYVPSVETADGNINGSLRFGSNTTYMDYRTAMHEIAHTVGVGQASNWGSFLANGLFTGERAAAQLNAINATLSKPLYTELHADTQHFWPYGINQQSEVKGEADLIFHCQMVVAIRQDLGLK